MANIKKVPEFILRLMGAVEAQTKLIDPAFDFGVAHNPINPMRSVSYFGRQGPHDHAFTVVVYHDLIDRTLPEHLHEMAARCIYVQLLETDIREENEGDTLKYLMRAQFVAGESLGVTQHPGRAKGNRTELEELAQGMAMFLTKGELQYFRDAEIPKK